MYIHTGEEREKNNVKKIRKDTRNGSGRPTYPPLHNALEWRLARATWTPEEGKKEEAESRKWKQRVEVERERQRAKTRSPPRGLRTATKKREPKGAQRGKQHELPMKPIRVEAEVEQGTSRVEAEVEQGTNHRSPDVDSGESARGRIRQGPAE